MVKVMSACFARISEVIFSEAHDDGKKMTLEKWLRVP